MSPVTASLLFLHVLGAIVAFGPNFTFPFITSLANRMPQFGLFALRLSDLLEKRLIIPLGLFQAVTGIGLILTVPFDLFASTSHWLLLGIALYAVAISFAIFVQVRTVDGMLHILEAIPAPAGSPAATPLGGPPPGPPPEFLRLSQRARNGGMFLTVLLIAIIFLMAVKPQF